MVTCRRIGLMVLAVAAVACGTDRSANAQQRPITGGAKPATVDNQRRTAIVTASERIAPAVVSIRVTLPQQQVSSGWIFGPPQIETPQSFGTGFILRKDGIILTNQHVVENAKQITVTLADGSDVEGRVLGEDPLTDIAVIKVARDNLPVVTVGKSSDLMIGEWAIAVGNPYSFMLGNSEPTVTAGVISATGRNIVPSGEQSGLYLDMIQTDAAINPGNSGGPLANALGEVIGINSSIFSSSGGSVGLGFAIPIERATRIADEIIKNGTVQRAWTGIEVAGASQMTDWKQTGGATISQIAPESPAAKAGLKAHDVLIQANGRKLRNWLDWEAVKIDLHVGDTASVTLISSGQTLTKRFTLGDLPSTLASKVRLMQGLELVTLTPAVRVERGVKSTQGALIYRVTPEISGQTGLQAGDVIYAVNQRVPITSAQDVTKIFNATQRGQQVNFWIERNGQTGIISVPIR